MNWQKVTLAVAICAACMFAYEVAWAHDNGNPNGNHPHHGDHGHGGNGGQGGNGGHGGQGGNGGTATATSTSSANASSSSSSGSSANTSTHIGGDDAAASSAASLYLSGCATGAGAQGMGFGASLGGESRVCQLLRVAAAHQALGMHFEAARIVRQAAEELNVHPSEAPPLARATRWIRRNLVQPIFSLVPFVGGNA